jgi:hypothetical protein
MDDSTNFGLNENFRYYEIYLDSLDATSKYDVSQTSLDWPLFQLATPIPGLAAMKILEVQIPFSFYIINSSNNTFLLTESNGVTNATVTIPPGNYSSDTLTSQFETSLNAASTFTYTVTFAGFTSTPNTGKFLISSNQGGTETFSLIFGNADDTGTTNPRLYLGFPAGTTTSNTSQALLAPNAALISGPNYLYLNSRSLGPLISALLPQGAVNLGKGSSGPQLAKIPINVQPGGVIYWCDPNPLMWFSLENLGLLNQLDFYITIGNNATPIVTQLNGLSFSIKMGLLQNNQTVDKLQGSSSKYPASTISLPRKRTYF